MSDQESDIQIQVIPTRPPRYVWQELSDPSYVGNKAVDAPYNDRARRELFDYFAHPPRVVLDIGCATGATALAVKETYGARAIGIELDPATAAKAAERLDLVITHPIEQVEPSEDGLQLASVDTVILADVIEHMYDPWKALVGLHRFLTPDAQLVASIPNLRNLWLMHEVTEGRWQYEIEGLLDVTHIRFFTFREMHRLFAETGYHIEFVGRNEDPRAGHLNPVFEGTINIDAGRLRLNAMTSQEVVELTTLQFLMRVRPGAAA